MSTPPPITALRGLSLVEARERLAAEGPNELPRARRRTAWRIAAEVLREPMLAMLLAAGAIYLLLGDTTEALILILFAGFSIVVTIVQETRTEHVLESLRDLAAPRAMVIRDGETVRIPGREVVRGDLLLLEQGDRIAADALLVEAREVQADESLLTGESVPVRKRVAEPGEPECADPGGDDRPQVYSGAIITHGSGIARVIATGHRSRIGEIGRSLETLDPEAPRLQQEMGRIVRLCATGGIGIALLVVALYGLFRGGWLDAVLAGIAIGMSLLPEEFPVVLTIFLAMGAWRIAQAGVLTRRVAAIESMGAVTVLCTDKTGTLTQNRMTVSELWTPDGATHRVAEAELDVRFHALVEAGMRASAPVPTDPMEVAFHEVARALPSGRDGGDLVHSYGLRPELLAMSNVWRVEDDGPLAIAAKGAPEAIARLCRLEGTELAAIEAAARAMAERGMRVLGVASGDLADSDLGKAHHEHDFRLLGLVGLSDPLRSGVPDAVAQCQAAGVRVVMITGDYAATARAIATEAGIASGEVMTGEELALLDDAALAARVGPVTVFARIMPEQKLRIVNALKTAGEVVAMTGDGVNDAPALKAAHVGVAMGRRGTDVAREAAAIVLVDDEFGAIIEAIRLGRRIYDNIRKAVAFIFGVHVPIAGLALLPLVTGLPLVFGPIQIALLEMIIDPVCALVFEAEPEEHNLMRRPPRRPDERLVTLPLLVRSVVQGGVAFVVLGAIYLVGARSGLDAATLRTLVFFGLVGAVVALILADRAFGTSLIDLVARGNTALRWVLAFIALAALAVLTIAPVRGLLQFTALSWVELAAIAGSTLGLLALFEATKRVGRPE